MVSVQVALMLMTLSGTGQTVMLDFYNDHCGPCRLMDPVVQALIAKGYPVRRVNTEQDPGGLAAQFNVTMIPCFVMVVEGREVDRVTGSNTTFSRLERMCRLGLPQASPSAPLVARNGSTGNGPSVPVPPMTGSPPFAQAGQRRSGAPPAVAATGGLAVPAATPPLRPAGLPVNAAAASADALVAASVRLRVKDADGHSCGSGTIIDARDGYALVLTCGHIFRDSGGKGQIEVDLFGPNGPQRAQGMLKHYDLTRDVGLVVMATPGPVAVAKVAPPGYRVGQGEPVISVGCNNGDRPTALRSRVTSVDKFLGPPTLQVAGQPMEGRSGGGLFSDDGLLVGVCNAADPSDREGLFAALPSIHAALDQAQLALVYQSSNDRAVAQATPQPKRDLVPADRASAPGQVLPASWNSSPASEPRPLVPTSAHEPPNVSSSSPPLSYTGRGESLSKEEQAALDEIHRRQQDDAEVIVVIRSRRDPAAKSEIMRLSGVSPQFLKQLTTESRAPEPPPLSAPETPPAAWPAGR